MAKQKPQSESQGESKETPVADPPQSAEPTNPAQAVGTETLESIANHVDEVAPVPNEAAIAHAQAENEKKEDEPKQSKRGQGQEGKVRGPYKTKSQVVQPKKSKTVEAFDEEKYKRCYMAGASTINGLVGMSAQFFGEEWYWRPPKEIVLPDGKRVQVSEQAQGEEVAGKAFAYNGWEGPNPNVALFMFAIGFIIERLRQPETKKKVFGFLQKVRDEIKRRRESAKSQQELKKVEA